MNAESTKPHPELEAVTRQPESDKEGFNLIEHLQQMQAETEASAEYQVDLRKQSQFAARQALELHQKLVDEKCDRGCDIETVHSVNPSEEITHDESN